ncbi:MAG: hypothetical protein IT317_23355 [Anaerolineales bacterium]|nr:hypothetical protein [Anaerolineales bacterium]
MSITIQIHISNEEPVVAEVETLPTLTDTVVVAQNPRLRDGKDLRYLAPNVTTVIYPMTRVMYIQVLPSSEEERIVGFVRD